MFGVPGRWWRAWAIGVALAVLCVAAIDLAVDLRGLSGFVVGVGFGVACPWMTTRLWGED